MLKGKEAYARCLFKVAFGRRKTRVEGRLDKGKDALGGVEEHERRTLPSLKEEGGTLRD
jgi:hypothetical protein